MSQDYPRKTFIAFLIGGLSDDSKKSLQNQVQSNNNVPLIWSDVSILHCVPSKVKADSLFSDIKMFCFPSSGSEVSETWQQNTTYTFVLTNMYGEKYYCASLVVCEPLEIWRDNALKRKTIFVRKCFCIVSQLSYCNQLCSILKEIWSCFVSNNTMAVHQILHSLFLIPVLPPVVQIEFHIPAPTKTFCLKTRPESSKLPLLDVPVSVLFSLLSFDNVMLFISAILCERKIVVKSSQLSLLTLVCETALSLIWPLQWHYVYIPLLPSSLTDYLDAPTPFIMGVHSSWADSLPANDLVVVDVDLDLIMGHITSDSVLPKEDSLNLRKHIRKVLKPEFFKLDTSFPHYSSFKDVLFFSDLFEPQNEMNKLIRSEFMMLIDTLFPNFKDYYGQDFSFHTNKFLEDAPIHRKNFLEKITRTESFEQFKKREVKLFTRLQKEPIATRREFLFQNAFKGPSLVIKIPPPHFPSLANNTNNVNNENANVTSTNSTSSSNLMNFEKLNLRNSGDRPGTQPQQQQQQQLYLSLSNPNPTLQIEPSLFDKVKLDEMVELLDQMCLAHTTIEALFLRGLYQVLSQQYVLALQDFERILELNDKFQFPDKLLEFLVQTLLALESKPEYWSSNNSKSTKPILGEKMRHTLAQYETAKRSRQKEANNKMKRSSTHGQNLDTQSSKTMPDIETTPQPTNNNGGGAAAAKKGHQRSHSQTETRKSGDLNNGISNILNESGKTILTVTPNNLGIDVRQQQLIQQQMASTPRKDKIPPNIAVLSSTPGPMNSSNGNLPLPNVGVVGGGVGQSQAAPSSTLRNSGNNLNSAFSPVTPIKK